MPPVFAHGRLRLYLLKLLDEAPRHGYEMIRLLEERFQGLYAPSAGTVYPRLAKLEAEGLVGHATEGGRKVYSVTDAGRAELDGRRGELAELELEIQDSVTALAADIREDVRGAAGDLRREMRREMREAAAAGPGPGAEWKEQARRAKEESRRARQEAQQARRQARRVQENARDEVLRVKERVQEQVREHTRRGDWPTGLVEGVNALARELGSLAGGRPPASAPEWGSADDSASADSASADPARDLDRLLDRFRDEIRDVARDHGVTAEQLAECRGYLAEAVGRVGAVLRR
ncbi:helix-turn-helix transcriptional regulator [Streptomyces sp. AV19]|uniref:PadR family transcriptional regulator n=1 Tax=Streptomyces sp. AV19 TaxID=2793068 RepID=UPI0018FE8DF6|nr:PadR family transcriptional regulator [Streptomyces sp. AV19]MBH1933604.1 helix-turn-helix transcriptional regulator [Streptomyces sp. AV19]MDG4535890.1 PadR family transcriptional regulator [Streptomyces sp. AV19]